MRRHGPVIAHCTDSEDFPVLVRNFSLLIGSDDRCVLCTMKKMAILEAVHYFTTITIFSILSLILHV